MGAGDPISSDEASISELREKHRLDLKNLTLTTQHLKTFKFFVFASALYMKQSILYILTKGVWFTILTILVGAFGLLLIATDGPHEKHVQEFLSYSKFALWWVALGVASSIGLGSGLHTFVLYLGPHIALFTLKAVQCGRIDIKTASYDTIQLKRGPSWLDSLVQHLDLHYSHLTLIHLLRFHSASCFHRFRLRPFFGVWELHLENFHLILYQGQHAYQEVPNPLFDLAGIMCGQFGIPFLKFFLATLVGKAIVKTHIQTVFIISVCNNQLFELMENEFIWVFGHIPGFSSMLPNIISKLHKLKQKFLSASFPDPATLDAKAKQWNLSFTLIWNTVIWLMILNFFVKIVTDTAQRYLKRQQELEINNKIPTLRQSTAIQEQSASK